MLATAKNSDFLLCHLRVASRDMQHPLKERFEIFQSGIKQDILFASNTLKANIKLRLPELFEIRLASLRWIVRDKINLVDTLDGKVQSSFMEMKRFPRLSAIADDLISAFQLNQLIIHALIKISDTDIETLDEKEIPEITLSQFIALEKLNNPNVGEAVSLEEWIHCTLFMEYLALAATTIFDNNMIVGRNIYLQMSSLLQDTIEVYRTMAIDLKIINESEILQGGKRTSLGAPIFKRMLQDKKEIHEHLVTGNHLSELKDKYHFVDPLSINSK